MYFRSFPKIFYDFNVGAEENRLQILTDVTKNVRVRKQILENITLYDEYDMMEGETPEIVAEKFYGNPELHWIIMLINQRYDYLEDFPMSSLELEEYIDEKYGEGNRFNIHHYEKNGLVVEGMVTLKVPLNTVSPVNLFKKYDFVQNSTLTANGRVENIDVANRILTVMMDYGRFSAGEIISVKGFRENPETGEKSFSDLVFAFTVPQNGFNILTGYSVVTNYDYEIKENEKKRRIKLIAPELINQFITEFESLMA